MYLLNINMPHNSGNIYNTGTNIAGFQNAIGLRERIIKS